MSNLALPTIDDARSRWIAVGIALSAIAAVAFLNRLRGGLFVLPCRNLYVAGPLVGAVVWILRRNLVLSITVAIGYVVWGFRSWSIWIQAHFAPDLAVQPPDVRLLDFLGQHTWAGGFFARHWIMLWPLQIALLWLQPGWRAQILVVGLAALLTCSYALGWFLTPVGNGIATSEWIAGTSWGLFIVALCFPFDRAWSEVTKAS